MQSTDFAVPRNRENDVRERLEREAANHRIRILHDDGLYRHLRFTRPGTWAYGYDLITWPGQLAIAGDCGDYTFARIRDMFEFFRGEHINPGYWSEKLTNHDMRDGTRHFEPELFRPRVMEWYEQRRESYGDEDGSRLTMSRPTKTNSKRRVEHDGSSIDGSRPRSAARSRWMSTTVPGRGGAGRLFATVWSKEDTAHV